MPLNTLDTPTLVTCGLPYANGDLHIGHLRGLIAGDVYTRAVRQTGGRAAYVCGSDVHGTPIALAAAETEETPRSLALSYHTQFKQRFPALDISLDAYGHTDTDRNYDTTYAFIDALVEDGTFIEQDVAVAVDTSTGEVLPDRYVEGGCPQCGNTARGDECEHCGRHLEPGDVANPISTRTGATAEYEKRRHGFIDLPAYEETIRSFVEGVAGSPQVTARTEDWLDSGLRPWCITRDLSWGVPDPTDDERVLYVWIDALSEYVSATKKYSEQPDAAFDWTDVWKEDGDVVHVIGKDIIQHHTTLWPALLSSAGFSLPSALLASGFVTLDGAALSTSRNHAVWAEEYVNTGYDPAFLRYYLTGVNAFEDDVDFTWEALAEQANNNLVNTVGNYLYRVSSLGSQEEIAGVAPSKNVQQRIQTAASNYIEAVEGYRIRDIVTTPVELARYGNEFLQKNEPWNASGQRRRQTIADAAYIARVVLATLKPVAPTATEDVWDGFFQQNSGDIRVGAVPLTGSLHDISPPFEPIQEE